MRQRPGPPVHLRLIFCARCPLRPMGVTRASPCLKRQNRRLKPLDRHESDPLKTWSRSTRQKEVAFHDLALRRSAPVKWLQASRAASSWLSFCEAFPVPLCRSALKHHRSRKEGPSGASDEAAPCVPLGSARGGESDKPAEKAASASRMKSARACSLPEELIAAVGPVADSLALNHGGRQVEAVIRHRRLEPVDGEAQWLVEKRLTASRFGPPARELFFYSRIAPFIRLKPLDLPRLYYAGRVGRADYLLLEWLEGDTPRLSKELQRLGRGIATLEASSSRWLASLPREERTRLEPLNFFRSWWQRGGFRYAYVLYLPRTMLRRGLLMSQRRRFFRVAKLLFRLERRVRRDPACVCHLDLSGKNLILGEDRLSVIDWGEACLGRPGFDVGALLALLARRSPQRHHERARGRLLKTHEAALVKRAPELLAAARRGRAYYMACSLLFYLARGEHAERDVWLLELIEEDLEAALAEPDTTAPAAQDTPPADQAGGDKGTQGGKVKGEKQQAKRHHPEAQDGQEAKKAAEKEKHAQR